MATVNAIGDIFQGTPAMQDSNPMDSLQQEPSSALAALASLLEELGIGSGRITPRPRGSRLTEEERARLEDTSAAAQRLPPTLVYGNACYALGRHEDAVEVYRGILNVEPADTTAKFNLGLACLRLRRPAEAVQEFTSVLVGEPGLAEAYYQRGNAHDDIGESERALADYTRAIELDPEYVQAMYNRGIVLGRRDGTTRP